MAMSKVPSFEELSTALKLNTRPVLQNFDHPLLAEHKITLTIKRDDLIHPIISGNKAFKLIEHLKAFTQGNYETLVSFGGAYSNHIHACAYAAKQLEIPFLAIIRGEKTLPLNPTLKDCKDWQTQIEYVNRQAYQQKENSPDIQKILSRYPSAYVIPEGGSGVLGVQGAKAILQGVDQSQFDYVICACGTGTTLSGLIASVDASLSNPLKAIGVPVLKAQNWMDKEIQDSLAAVNCHNLDYRLWHDYHFGGYAKTPAELLQFIDDTQITCGLGLDPIYTAKAFWGLLDRVKRGDIPTGSRVLFIHTGGMQGAR